MSKLTDTLAVPVVSGAIAAAEAAYMFSDFSAMEVPLLGTMTPAMGFGVTTAVATAVGQVGGNYVLPYIPKIGSYANLEKRVAGPLVTGLADVALVRSSNAGVGMGQAFLVGASSHLLGQYVVDMYQGMGKPY